MVHTHDLCILNSFRINNGVEEALAGHKPTDYRRWKDETFPYTVYIHTYIRKHNGAFSYQIIPWYAADHASQCIFYS